MTRFKWLSHLIDFKHRLNAPSFVFFMETAPSVLNMSETKQVKNTRHWKPRFVGDKSYEQNHGHRQLSATYFTLQMRQLSIIV